MGIEQGNNNTEESDRRIFTAAELRSGDPAIVMAFYEQYNGILLRKAKTMLRNQVHAGDAEEAVQDAWLTMFKNIENIQNPASYLYSSVVNRATSILRRRGIRDAKDPLLTSDFSQMDPAIIVSEAAERNRIAIEVRSAVKRLPGLQQDVMGLELDGANEADKVIALNRRPGTIRSSMSRARRTLQNDPSIRQLRQ